jgi:hypothetical protein
MIFLSGPDAIQELFGAHRHYHYLFKSLEKPPIALQICHESRALALKHYITSFHSMTHPLERASEMKQTALYFNPKLDTVHVKDDEFWTLSGSPYPNHMETTQSIRTLAVGSQDVTVETEYVARGLRAFEKLEMLILVVDGEMAELSWLRVNMEDDLVKAKGRLVAISQGKCREWKQPVVKAMTRRAFENNL